MTYVYKIEIEGITAYIGITDDLKKRENRHNEGLKGREDKMLYDYINAHHPGFKIRLIPIKAFEDRIDALRYEVKLVLDDYFGPKQLRQYIMDKDVEKSIAKLI